jgi:hypothetical protein
MKFNFRKISAVIASGLMTVSAVGFAAAANFPAPFVVGGSADGAVVYGTGAGALDQTPANSIGNYLAGMVTVGTEAPTGGDFVLIEGTGDKFNLGDSVDDFYTTIDEDELGTLLAEGTYTSDSHDDYDYDQQMTFTADQMILTHFQDNNFNDEKPIIGFELGKGVVLLDYKLEFDEDVDGGTDWASIINSYLPLLGKEYYVLSMTNTSNINHKITLLNAAVSGSLSEGESITLSSGASTYEVSVKIIDSNNKVKLIINGMDTDLLEVSETQNIGNDIYIGIKEVSSQGYAGGTSNVEFSIGSGKLVLQNGTEVEINSEKLSKEDFNVANSDDKTISYVVTSTIETDGEDLKSISLEWKTNDKSWIAPGTEMVMPGFESVKLYMNEFVIPDEEVTSLSGNSDTLTLSTTLKDGDIDLDILYLNSSATGIEGIGADSDSVLFTGTGASGGQNLGILVDLNGTQGTYFAVTWVNGDEGESYVYEFDDVDDTNADDNTTTLSSLSGGNDISVDIDETKIEGNIKFTLISADDEEDGNAQINISATGSADTIYIDRLVTAEGMMIELPVDSRTVTAAIGNNMLILGNASTDEPILWHTNVSEEDEDDNIESGGYFVVTVNMAGTDGIRPGAVSYGIGADIETAKDSDTYESYVVSELATKATLDKSDDLYTLDISYAGTESYAEVYIAETSVSTSAAGQMVFKDSEKSSWQNKNVVVVGGSCINSAAATLLGGALCEGAFTDATGVGAGQYVVQSFADGFTSGKVALLVAGYHAADTVAAASRLIEPGVSVDTSAGTKYIGTVGVSGSSTMSKVE